MHEQDQALVARMLAGEQRAFDAFFQAYATRLAAFASRRSRLPAMAIEDIVQNSLIKAMRKIATFRGESALFTWLCEICRRELADLHRKSQRQPREHSLDVLPLSPDILLELRTPSELEPANELDMAAHRSAIAATLNGLPERYAQALELKYGDGFSVQEIARMLGLTTTAAQSLLQRAREAFKRCWQTEQTQ